MALSVQAAYSCSRPSGHMQGSTLGKIPTPGASNSASLDYISKAMKLLPNVHLPIMDVLSQWHLSMALRPPDNRVQELLLETLVDEHSRI